MVVRWPYEEGVSVVRWALRAGLGKVLLGGSTISTFCPPKATVGLSELEFGPGCENPRCRPCRPLVHCAKRDAEPLFPFPHGKDFVHVAAGFFPGELGRLRRAMTKARAKRPDAEQPCASGLSSPRSLHVYCVACWPIIQIAVSIFHLAGGFVSRCLGVPMTREEKA